MGIDLGDTMAILVAHRNLPFPETDWKDQLKRVEVSPQLLLTFSHWYFILDIYILQTCDILKTAKEILQNSLFKLLSTLMSLY